MHIVFFKHLFTGKKKERKKILEGLGRTDAETLSIYLSIYRSVYIRVMVSDFFIVSPPFS